MTTPQFNQQEPYDAARGHELDDADVPLETRATRQMPEGNSRFFLPIMLGLMLVGLIWVVVFYLSSYELPIKALGRWNLGVGVGLMLAGFAMTTRWQ